MPRLYATFSTEHYWLHHSWSTLSQVQIVFSVSLQAPLLPRLASCSHYFLDEGHWLWLPGEGPCWQSFLYKEVLVILDSNHSLSRFGSVVSLALGWMGYLFVGIEASSGDCAHNQSRDVLVKSQVVEPRACFFALWMPIIHCWFGCSFSAVLSYGDEGAVQCTGSLCCLPPENSWYRHSKCTEVRVFSNDRADGKWQSALGELLLLSVKLLAHSSFLVLLSCRFGTFFDRSVSGLVEFLD